MDHDPRRTIIKSALGLLLAVAGNALGVEARPLAAPNAASTALHVPSPDWRDQVIYFVMTDRFDDGDPRNNDQGAGEFDPSSNAHYNGGDFKGIERRLDYIRGLGATAVWVTPPVANQWWNTTARYGGYHGYWAENFMAVDAHNGSLADYQRLSRKLHAAGMYLVQDIVVNHTANYFGYAGDWNSTRPAQQFRLVPDSRGRMAPTQSPFDRNDARDPMQRTAATYHWTPDITDFNDPNQVMNFQLAGLDDLNTEHPQVRESLRESYGYWIREAGVDAFRVDTAFYVPPEFFTDFLYSDDADHPGILRVAAQTGRDDFHVFGEGFGSDKPYADEQARRIDDYMRSADDAPLLPGMLNFPLYATAADVFARGRPTAELAHRIGSMMTLHLQPHLMPTFVDNHDVDRFLAGGGQAGLKQNLLLLMTLPGIPTIYYGTEQGFTEPRAAMFAGGYGSGGKDHFDTTAPLYRFIQRATALRREHPLFSRGTPAIRRDNTAAPGVLAYRMSHGDDAALVVFNSADHDTLLSHLDTGLRPGTVLRGLFGIDAAPKDVVIDADGSVSMRLPARSGLVWKMTQQTAPVPATTAELTLDSLRAAPMRGDFMVRGMAKGLASFQLVVDGDVTAAQTVRPNADGRWQATIATGDMVDAAVEHEVVAWAESPAAHSARRRFSVARAWKVLADAVDPDGDDAGPRGLYRYPTDTGWGANRQLDIQRVRVSGAGGAIKIDLRMHQVTAPW
ncbi:MAG: alpha-amylase family glycosyl hydrolase, partial [Lysobacter sp.]